MKVIYILWLRQLKRYYRSKPRMIGSFGQPLLFLIALGFGLGPIFQQAGEGNYLQFLVPGIVTMGVLMTSIFSGIEIIWDRQFGFLKETLVAPVSRMEIMIGRTLGGATIAVMQGIVIILLSIPLGFRITNLSMIPLVLVFMSLTALTFTALGTAIASKLEDFQGFQLIMNFLVMPLFFLSGAIFPLHKLPKTLGIITRIDPLSYGVDGIRGTLTGVSYYGLSYDLLILTVMASVLLVIGSYLFSKIQI